MAKNRNRQNEGNEERKAPNRGEDASRQGSDRNAEQGGRQGQGSPGKTEPGRTGNTEQGGGSREGRSESGRGESGERSASAANLGEQSTRRGKGREAVETEGLDIDELDEGRETI